LVERLPSAGRLLGLLLLLLAGVVYALLLIATNEMAHGTLLGWRSLE
jgi:hypothetical protein